jgi:outer membrane receptor for ferrienterochelin and colicin
MNIIHPQTIKSLGVTMNRKITFLFIFILISFSFSIAGNTGKIAGKVVDVKTKEAVIGANVLIEGTSFGAATDLDGNYYIINIPPGTYTLKVSAVGYGGQSRKNVQVSIDLTSRQEFELTEAAIQTQEVVVVAEKPMVTKDLTASTAVVNSEQLQSLPVTEFTQVLNLQAGNVGGHVRGGRGGEVGYWIDGVPVTDVYDGSNVVEVNKDMIQELQMISGAFNAEYGQAMSGIVNIATKEGGDSYHGTISTYFGDYVSSHDDIFKGIDKINPAAIYNIEGSLNGPIMKDFSFYVTGRYINFDGYLNGIRKFKSSNVSYTDSAGTFHLYRDASGKGDSAVVPMNWSKRTYGQGKLTYKFSSLMKLSLNVIYDNTDYQSYDQYYQYNPDGLLNRFNRSITSIMQLSHSLSANTFYTLNLSYFWKRYQHYLYEDPYDLRYCNPNTQILPSYNFLAGGTDLSRFKRETQTMLAKLDITSQITQTHMVKLGIEGRLHKLNFESITLQPILSESSFNSVTSSPFMHTRIPTENEVGHDLYTRKPVEFSAYLQDKMEFKSLIVNIGLRLDYFHPDGKVLSDPSDPNIFEPVKPANRFFDANNNGIQDNGEASKTVADRQSYWYKDATDKIQLSPRFGASFPITDQGVIHFSYGYFFQIPRFELLYSNPFFKLGSGTGSVGVVGNADLKPEQTINGEVGLQQQLTEDISVDLTGFFRDIRDLSGTRSDVILLYGGASWYNKYVNSDFGFIKGVTLSINKNFSGGLSAAFYYTFQVCKGSASDPQETMNAINGGSLPEVQMIPLSWDQRQTANVTLTYFNNDWGGSLIAQYGSGMPYTPRGTTDITTLLTNSQIKPSTFNVDARLHKDFKIGNNRFTIYTQIYNLFDIKNEVGVFSETGRAGFTTDEQLLLKSGVKEYVNTIHDYYTIPGFYSEPRRIEIGINWEL